MNSGNLLQADTAFTVETGNFLSSADDVANLIVGSNGNQPVYLRQIAKVEDGAETPRQYVTFGYGAAAKADQSNHKGNFPAVTLAIAKKKGADAMVVKLLTEGNTTKIV